jgi:pimeloyl-ACP methyl ester carboxylesterase
VHLAAELRRARGEAIIVMAHGFCSNRHSLGRFDELAGRFQGLGYDVLAFDFSGCGESDPDVLTAVHETEDLKAVIAYVREELGFQRVALHGHSLGGAICLMAYDEGIETMVLTGTPTDAMHYDWLDHYGERRLEQLRATGTLKIGPWVLNQQSLLDFEQFDQTTLLSPVKCPVLLVHGGSSDDWEEQELLARSRRGINVLPAGSRLEIVDGAGHSFQHHMPELGALACGWYRERLPLP